MPVSFDFQNSAPTAQQETMSSGPNVVTNTADGVTFTVSSDFQGGAEGITFGNQQIPSVPLGLVDFGGGNDLFTLTFKSTLNTMHDQLSATAANPVRIEWGSGGTGSWRVEFLGFARSPTGTTFITNAATPGFATIVPFANSIVTGIRFSSLGSSIDLLNLTLISANALNCFCAGTAISTSSGDRPVEALQIGDKIRTADGRDVEVKWVGVQSINPQLLHPAKVNPICISAGTLGNERDLFVSPSHAIYVDGALVNASALVDGVAIYQVTQTPDKFAYYHIETDAHELILAEGIPCESYLPERQEFAFDNEATRPPREIAEMDLPRITSARLLPSKQAA